MNISADKEIVIEFFIEFLWWSRVVLLLSKEIAEQVSVQTSDVFILKMYISCLNTIWRRPKIHNLKKRYDLEVSPTIPFNYLSPIANFTTAGVWGSFVIGVRDKELWYQSTLYIYLDLKLWWTMDGITTRCGNNRTRWKGTAREDNDKSCNRRREWTFCAKREGGRVCWEVKWNGGVSIARFYDMYFALAPITCQCHNKYVGGAKRKKEKEKKWRPQVSNVTRWVNICCCRTQSTYLRPYHVRTKGYDPIYSLGRSSQCRDQLGTRSCLRLVSSLDSRDDSIAFYSDM